MAFAELPPVKPWADRRKSLPRLAGGNEQQLVTLRWLLTQVESREHTIDSVLQAYMHTYGMTKAFARANVGKLYRWLQVS